MTTYQTGDHIIFIKGPKKGMRTVCRSNSWIEETNQVEVVMLEGIAAFYATSFIEKCPPPILWDNYGESSLTMMSALVGIKKERPTIPRDPSDFARCVHLFECMGLHPISQEAKAILDKVAITYPIWKELVEKWPALYALFEEEKSTGKAPKLYAELGPINDRVDKMQNMHIIRMKASSKTI